MQKGYYQAPCLNFDEKEVVYPADEVCAAWISNRRTTSHIRCHVPFLCPVFTVFPLCFLFLGLRPSTTPQSNAMFITSRLSVNAVFQPKSEWWVPWLGRASIAASHTLTQGTPAYSVNESTHQSAPADMLQ